MPTRPVRLETESESGGRGGPPQQARSRRTRERIVEAATECFDRHGYDDTTTAMIARSAGIAVGTLYGHFADKREVLFVIVGRFADELDSIVRERLAPPEIRSHDPRAQADALIDAVFHLQTLRPGIQRVLWERYFKDPEFRAVMDATRSRTAEAVVAFCAAIDPALLRGPVDEVAARTIVHGVEWNAVHAHLDGSPEEIDAAAVSSAEMIARFLFRD